MLMLRSLAAAKSPFLFVKPVVGKSQSRPVKTLRHKSTEKGGGIEKYVTIHKYVFTMHFSRDGCTGCMVYKTHYLCAAFESDFCNKLQI